MKELPIGRQTFSEFIEQGLLYVDKTKYLHLLASSGKYYFLSRPRRFGKSLLLTTLKSFFEGKKKMFKGLEISQLEKEWQQYPVLLIDYSFVEYRSGKEIFNESLLRYLKSLSKDFDLEIQEGAVKNFFQEFVKALYEKYGPVVILVDEYDKPLVDVLTDPEKFEENRDVLNDFYSVLKGLDTKLRFVMLTGVSRFAKVSVFSGLNNLTDITLEEPYQSIVGFTEKEVRHSFDGYLTEAAKAFSAEREVLFQQVEKWYNGYSWGNGERVYNPFSLLNFFYKKSLSNYWFETGTPSFLVKLFREQKRLPEEMENLEVNDLMASTNNPNQLALPALLFQTGYLTIVKKRMVDFEDRYTLNYPNEEVRRSFLLHLLSSFSSNDGFQVQTDNLHIKDALRDGNIDRFLEILQRYFSNIPSHLHIPKEAYYHSLVYMILTIIGVKMDMEKPTDKGRIDGVLEFADRVYIIEFKFAVSKRVKNIDTLIKQAIKQIETNKYYEPYIGADKKILLLGIGFLNKKIGGRLKMFN